MEPGPDPMTAIVPANDGKPPPTSSKNKKKRRAMSFLRAALFMWQRRGSGKRAKATLQMQAAAASAGMLNMVVGSMRPLHVNGGESPPHVAAAAAALTLALPGPAETQPVPSPSPSPSPARSDRFEDAPTRHSSVSCEGSSRYSSALDLQELEKGEEGYDCHGDGEIDRYDADGGDEMIDVKAEEFIARFYEQMRIQNHNETARGSAHGGSW